MTSKEEKVRRRILDASRGTQSTVEARAKISRRAARRVQVGSDDEIMASSVSQNRASPDNIDGGVPSLPLSADQLLQIRLRETRARIRTKVHEPSDHAARNSTTPTRSRANRRASLPKLLQQHIANDSMAFVANSYAASPLDNNVHTFETDIDLLLSAPIWSKHSGSATGRTLQQQSRSESSSDTSLSISGLGDNMILDEVAEELASLAPRHNSSGEIVITAGGNLKSFGESGDIVVDDDDDDDLRGCMKKTVPLSDVNRVDGEDGLRMLMGKLNI
jgi:hypothetical protein